MQTIWLSLWLALMTIIGIIVINSAFLLLYEKVWSHFFRSMTAFCMLILFTYIFDCFCTH